MVGFGCEIRADFFNKSNQIMKKVFIDVETYSDIDLPSCGAYKYARDQSFEILILSYAIDDGEVKTLDLTKDMVAWHLKGCIRLVKKDGVAALNGMPQDHILLEIVGLLFDADCEFHAYNAVFERLALKYFLGIELPMERWVCDMAHAAYHGLPLKLDTVGKMLRIKNQKKAGLALIKFFSCPCKPTKRNGMITRNRPEDNPEKWADYLYYNKYDVLAEREIYNTLQDHFPTKIETKLYRLDQAINDRGVGCDLALANSAIKMRESFCDLANKEIIALTGLDKPNSPMAMKAWVGGQLGETLTTLDKAKVAELIADNTNEKVTKVLKLRQVISKKTSLAKYDSVINSATYDEGTDMMRIHGMLQFYGASRTGRWAGRLVQLHNVPQNHIEAIDKARAIAVEGDSDLLELLYGSVTDTLSQLIRTVFIAPKGKTFGVADFSAIEARVLAWLAGEEWKLEVFRTHGKIYEATASRMFGVPIEDVTHGSLYRTKGKISELAFGYGGGAGAIQKMGGEKMGLTEEDAESCKNDWRKANPEIKRMWYEFNDAMVTCVQTGASVKTRYHGITFSMDKNFMSILLPSGRELLYYQPKIVTNRFGSYSVGYTGLTTPSRQIATLETYGGKITENIVQAIARDILGLAMFNLEDAGFLIVMHVHDECICEIPADDRQEANLLRMQELMALPVSWAKGLPLRADGYVTPFYKKD